MVKILRDGVEYDLAVMAGRPIDFEQYPTQEREIYRGAMVDAGMEPPLYPGHIEKPCILCDIATQVGPRQQEQIEKIGESNVVIVCLMHAPVLMTARDHEVVSLGNPTPPIQHTKENP